MNANFRSKFRNELSVKANFRSKFPKELSVKANFRSKIPVNYNSRHCENSANFLRTFALDKNSPFFLEKPRNSRILSNYLVITFSQYCNHRRIIAVYQETQTPPLRSPQSSRHRMNGKNFKMMNGRKLGLDLARKLDMKELMTG